MKKRSLIFIFAGFFLLSQFGQAANIDIAKSLNKSYLQNLKYDPSLFTVLKERDSQAAADVEDDGEPSGPTNEVGLVFLKDVYDSVSPVSFEQDFSNVIPYSDVLFRDHSSLNTYYFYPSLYLLKRDAEQGFALNFLHRTRTDESTDELISMTFTLQPRELPGAISLLEEFADRAIKPKNNKPVDLRRLPISSVQVSLSGLSSLISAENVVITNVPQHVGDPITVQAKMNLAQKEDIVASIREGGLSGQIVFVTNNDSFELKVPYSINFHDFSGGWTSNIRSLSSTYEFKNQSPHPLNFSGVVAYTKKGKNLHRYKIKPSSPVLMSPGAMAKSDKSFSQLLPASYGSIVSVWPDFEKVACEECVDKVERDILVSPVQASKTSLPVEVIPNVFSEGTFGDITLFKLLVEVKSDLFSPDNSMTEIKPLTLRPENLAQTLDVYVNREEGNSNFSYRIRPFDTDGQLSGTTGWIKNNGVMDITITKKDIEGLIAQ